MLLVQLQYQPICVLRSHHPLHLPGLIIVPTIIKLQNIQHHLLPRLNPMQELVQSQHPSPHHQSEC